ncbi:Sec-independent protein translocase protein TatC [Bacteroidota bacterium]|nr:Sec-independent protein translocase protein TatC [Bacteroidota bacterium]
MPLDPPKEVYPYEKNMGFFDHIDELRKRLFRVAVVMLIGTVIGFIFVEELFEFIVLSPFSSDFFGYRFFCKAGHVLMNSDALCWTPPQLVMQSQLIQGQFVSAFKIAFVVGFVAAFPYIIYQIWSFIRPALSQKEIQKTRRSLGVVSLLFFTGLFFAYFFLVPLASNFLLGYSLNPQIQNIITISSVTGFVTFMSLATGLVFELPVLIYILARLGIVNSAFLKKHWRYAVVIIFLIAGIATPSPDMFSQVLLGTPLLGLYFIGIQVAKRVEKNRENEQ